MRKLLLILLTILLLVGSSFARAKYQGIAGKGGKAVKTSSTVSYKLEETYPGCLITVYLAGTVTKATIYSDNIGSVKANPFFANSLDASYFFYANDGRYDIKFSGAGIASPFTKADVLLFDATVAAFESPLTFNSPLSRSVNTISCPTCFIIPDQTGNNGKYLTTNGTNTSWGTISSGGETGLTFTFTGNGDLWDNGVAISQSGHTQFSPFARSVFRTTATSVDINLYLESSVLLGAIQSVFIRVNGQDYIAVAPTSLGNHVVTVSLPAGYKEVEFVASQQATPISNPVGNYIKGVTFNALATLIPPISIGRVVVFGDSTVNGGGISVTTPAQSSWNVILRQLLPNYSIVAHGVASATLADYVNSGGTATSFAATIAAMKPNFIYIAIGVNDYQVGTSSGAFNTNYGLMLDALHTAIPGARIYVQTPYTKASEAVNGGGSVLEDFRTRIRVLAENRASYVYLIDGPAILNLSERDGSDGFWIHANNAGHAWQAQYVRDTLLCAPTSNLNSSDFYSTENIVFTNTANTAVATNTIQRSGGVNNTSDSGGSSTKGVIADHWWIRFTITEINSLRYIGVSSTNTGTDFTTIRYAIAPTALGSAANGLGIYELGVSQITAGGNFGYLAGDVFQIRCEKGIIYYEMYRDQLGITTIFKSSTPVTQSMYPLYVKVVTWGPASTATNVQIHGLLR